MTSVVVFVVSVVMQSRTDDPCLQQEQISRDFYFRSHATERRTVFEPEVGSKTTDPSQIITLSVSAELMPMLHATRTTF